MGLAVLIFAWGLQYKLSLYAGPHSAIHHMVKAKLLIEEKHAAVPDSIDPGGPSSCAPSQPNSISGVFWASVLSLVLSGAISIRAREFRACERSRPLHSSAIMSAFFYRPPPERG